VIATLNPSSIQVRFTLDLQKKGGMAMKNRLILSVCSIGMTLNIIVVASVLYADNKPSIIAENSSSEPIVLTTKSGKIFGTVDLPQTPPPFPVMLVHAGSGPTNRDGNEQNYLRMLGRSLAQQGIAVVRFDKRGVGESSDAVAREEDLRLETYAEDTAAWIEMLRQDKRFNKVGIIGHSEGSLIGLLAQQKVQVDAFVSLSGPGYPLGKALREQLSKQLTPELMEANERIMISLEKGESAKEVPLALQPLYRPSVQPYIISMLRPDPSQLIAKVKSPILIVEGTNDIQAPPIQGHRLKEANPNAKLATIQRMCHVLKLQEPDEADLAPYLDTKRRLHPDLVPTIAGFLKSTFQNQP
jgi:uncharacterized protein